MKHKRLLTALGAAFALVISSSLALSATPAKPKYTLQQAVRMLETASPSQQTCVRSYLEPLIESIGFYVQNKQVSKDEEKAYSEKLGKLLEGCHTQRLFKDDLKNNGK